MKDKTSLVFIACGLSILGLYGGWTLSKEEHTIRQSHHCERAGGTPMSDNEGNLVCLRHEAILRNYER